MSSIEQDIQEIKLTLEIICEQVGLKNRVPQLLKIRMENLQSSIAVKDIQKPKSKPRVTT